MPKDWLTLIMLTSLSMTAGRTARAADVYSTLEAGLTAGYVSNPQLLTGPHESDERGQLILADHTSIETETGLLALTPRFASTRYLHESSLDIDTGSVDANYQRQLERGQWTFDAMALTDSTITSELGTTGFNNVNERHYLETVTSSYQYLLSERLSWQLQGAWQDTRYPNAEQIGLTDYTYGSVSTGPTWSFTERVNGSLTLGADEIRPVNGANEKDYSASVQLKRNFSERYAWRLSAGATHVNAGSTGSSTTSTYEVGAARHGERVQWDLSVRRSVVPIGLGFLVQQTSATLAVTVPTSERGSFNLGASELKSSSVTLTDFQVYSGASYYQFSAEWRYQLAERWMLSAAYAQSRARGGTPEALAIGNEARLGISWQSRRL